MTPEVVTQVMGYNRFKDLWDVVQELFNIQSWMEEDYLRQTFQQTRKGNNNMFEYLWLMILHFDNLWQSRNPFTMKAFISQVLLGLDEDYHEIVVTFQGKSDQTWLQNEVGTTLLWKDVGSREYSSSKCLIDWFCRLNVCQINCQTHIKH